MNISEIESFIEKYPDWYQENEELVAGFEFKDFAAVEIVLEKIMKVIKKHNHHPVVSFGYNTIEIRTTTHDQGNIITEKDTDLAKEMSEVISN